MQAKIILSKFGDIQATFTQQQNTVVNPVFESLIRLHSHCSVIYGRDNRIL